MHMLITIQQNTHTRVYKKNANKHKTNTTGNVQVKLDIVIQSTDNKILLVKVVPKLQVLNALSRHIF